MISHTFKVLLLEFINYSEVAATVQNDLQKFSLILPFRACDPFFGISSKAKNISTEKVELISGNS